MKKAMMVLASGLVFVVAAFAAPRYMMVSSAGMGTDTDQSTADQNADSQARTNLQNACSAGTLTSSTKIFDQCSKAGDQYVCSVNYTGVCAIGN